jgi:DNA-binding CsgD family transcriptional regulator
MQPSDTLWWNPFGTFDEPDLGFRCASVAREILRSPLDVLKRTAAEALLLCGAHSAGVSLLHTTVTRDVSHWRREAVVGPWARLTGSAVPPGASPEALTLDEERPLVLGPPWPSDVDIAALQPLATEMLLVPLQRHAFVKGVLWVVLHDSRRRFTAADARRLRGFSCCAVTAYEAGVMVQTRNAAAPDAGGASRTADHPILSRREQQVCALVARGYTNREIAAALEVGTKSVDTYRTRIADKLNLRSRAALVEYALQNGWLSCGRPTRP